MMSAMLTQKMKKVADDIGEVILKYYDRDYLTVLFSSGITINDVIFQVLVNCCRYAFLTNMDKRPLSHYFEQGKTEPESTRKVRERTMTYVDKKFDKLESYRQKTGNSIVLRPNKILVKQKHSFPAYEISDFENWEIVNIHDMELVKAVVENRISCSHKITNTRFREIAGQYDDFVEGEKSRFGKDAESTVLSSIKLYTLQTKYAFDFLYEVAVEMEEQGVKEFPNMHDRLMTVTGTGKSESPLPDLCPDVAADVDRIIEYPLILQRRRFIESIVNGEKGSTVDSVLGGILEASVLANAVKSHMHLGGQRLPVCIAQETTTEDWASVFEIFDVGRAFVIPKDWTDARIQSVRKMYGMLSLNYKKI